MIRRLSICLLLLASCSTAYADKAEKLAKLEELFIAVVKDVSVSVISDALKAKILKTGPAPDDTTLFDKLMVTHQLEALYGPNTSDTERGNLLADKVYYNSEAHSRQFYVETVRSAFNSHPSIALTVDSLQNLIFDKEHQFGVVIYTMMTTDFAQNPPVKKKFTRSTMFMLQGDGTASHLVVYSMKNAPS